MKAQVDINNLLEPFKHKTSTKVQFYQVDSFQILHNIQYLYMFENARLEYLQSLGLANHLTDLTNGFPVMTVHHEIDYFSPAHFNDIIDIFTRVKEIGNSSIKFENIAISNDKLHAKATTVYVYINPLTGDSLPLPQNIREIIIL